MPTDTANGGDDRGSSRPSTETRADGGTGGSDPNGADAATGSGGGAMRSSMVMAAGTLVSRLTGFVKAIALAAALGTQLLGDAYNTANTIPFIINDLLIGGLIASVIIPYLVKRRKRDADGGRATEERLFTSAVLALAAITAIAILGAELLIRAYASGFTPAQADISVYLARFLLGQIFFVGLSGLISGMLNTRNKFGAPVWAPVLNNLVVIGVVAVFLWIAGPGRSPETITDAELTLLGVGTVGGMAVQTVVLLGSLWRSGFRWRPRLDLRGSGLGEALRSTGWMMLYTAMTQVSFLVTTNIAVRSGTAAAESGADAGAGITAYNYAFQLFQLPYAIIAVSLITVLLPQMSGFAADERWDQVREGFSRTLRVSALILVPLGLALALYAVQLSIVVFARGNTSTADAANIGTVLAVMALGLVPFTVFQLMLRVFYAMSDTRTPALISIANTAVHCVLAVTAYLVLPPDKVIAGVAAAFMFSFVTGLVIAGTILSRRLGGLDGRRVLGTLLRLHLATVPSILAGYAVLRYSADAFGDGLVTNLGAPAVGCLVGALLFLLFAKLLRIRELSAVAGLVRARLGRR
ncbi:putative peptidoglycan lipid II flippase [Murinocardiopsis flavida]|uniref:Putative peptidoglycan lipid II flippase n=1 Tax=Murinocardiopsis flavida TaxID=645275 RepID=A0A2P8DE56_9ACTN|nr:murein biosynthesis integral membrane protein MurJ [Murinocardiopsis flavida]PSK95506.1 putative peptidoglycan lipid II flippase [Murinocardiopsis flavida]